MLISKKKQCHDFMNITYIAPLARVYTNSKTQMKQLATEERRPGNNRQNFILENLKMIINFERLKDERERWFVGISILFSCWRQSLQITN